MNWEQRLREAYEAGAFTDEDKILAATWETSAVGEHIRANNYRVDDYLPSALSELQSSFRSAVERDAVEFAASVRIEIIRQQMCAQCGTVFHYLNGGYCSACTG